MKKANKKVLLAGIISVLILLVAMAMTSVGANEYSIDEIGDVPPEGIPLKEKIDVNAIQGQNDINAVGIYTYSGKIQFLRINEAGGYGPPGDWIDTEVVMGLFGSTKRFGFQLRNGAYLPVHQAMFDITKDAFNYNRTIVTDVFIDPAKNNGIIYRITEVR